MNRLLVLLFATTTLIISSTVWGYGVKQTPSTKYIHHGDVMVLNSGVTSPAGARIYFQHGAVVNRGKVRQATPFCYMLVNRDPSDIETELNVAEDRFTISGTTNHYDFAAHDIVPFLIAGTSMTFSQDDSEKILITRYYLDSSSQPSVISLNCGIWAASSERNHLSLQEVKQALGDLIEFESR